MSLLDIFRSNRDDDAIDGDAEKSAAEESPAQESGPLKSYGTVRGKGEPVDDEVIFEKVFGSSSSSR